jgi:hypothetical protein
VAMGHVREGGGGGGGFMVFMLSFYSYQKKESELRL